MIRKALFLSLLLLGFGACVPTREAGPKDLSTEPISLPFKFETVEILDKRDTLLPMNWDTPFMSARKRAWVGNPALDPATKQDLESQLRRSEKADGIPAQVEFRLLEGICKINADWKSVTEYAQCKGELYVKVPGRNLVYHAFAEMYIENPTMNGTEKHTLVLYRQALKNVTFLTLQQVKKELKLE